MVADEIVFQQQLEGRLRMRSALTGLFALAALLMPSVAQAAMMLLCSWEGRAPVAITVDADAATALRYDRGSSYYAIEATKSGVWVLLDEPKLVLSIKLQMIVRPGDPNAGEWVDVTLAPYFDSGRCWK
jgi:hypothetical protein